MIANTTRKGFLRRAASVALGVVAAPLLAAEVAIDTTAYVQGVGPAVEDGVNIYAATSSGVWVRPVYGALGEIVGSYESAIGRVIR